MPLPSELLHVGRPNLGDRQAFLTRVNEILDRRWFTNAGPVSLEFEARLREFLDVRHCVTVCNATVGLEIAIRACGLSGEVIVPSFTFVATAHALQWQGLRPVFCDIDPRTHNVDPAQVERLITPRTTGILAVHCWGRPCEVEALQKIASRHGLKLLFDASHAFGCSHEGRMIGGFGNAEIFSFHATKFINTFEGGVITTNDSELAKRLELMRNFGFTGFDQVDELGTNGKMSEICAAMGLTNLESVDDFIAVNRHNHDYYAKSLAGIPGITVLRHPGPERCNYQYVILEIDPATCPVPRDTLLQHLHENCIYARRYFYPGCHRMEPYRTLDPSAGAALPETEGLCERVMALPTGTSITAKEIDQVCGLIRDRLEPL